MTNAQPGIAVHASNGDHPLVGFVSPSWPPEQSANGIVTYTANIRAGLQHLHVNTLVLSRNVTNGNGHPSVVRIPAAAQQYQGFRRLLIKVSYRLAPESTNLRLAAGALLAEIRRLHAERGLELVEMEESLGLAGLVAQRSPVPIVVRLHGPWVVVGAALGVRKDAAFRHRVRNEGAALSLAAGVSASSRDVLERVRTWYELELADALVIPNPIAPVPAEQRWTPTSCDPGRILFVGRFDRVKGADVLIRALAHVLRVHPPAHLTCVGPDPGVTDEQGRHWSAEEFTAHCLPSAELRARVEWLGPRSGDEIRRLRRQCGMAVVASRYENFPMVGLEALACGSPLIASNIGGLAEMIQHERNGLLCHPGDHADLARKILTLLQNPELAARIGCQAARDAEERYHPRTIAQQTLDFHRSVIAETRPQRPPAAPLGAHE